MASRKANARMRRPARHTRSIEKETEESLATRHDPTGTPRIITLNVEPAAYELVAAWAERRGYQIVLVVTTPGPAPRTYTGHQEIVASAPHDQDILVVTKLKRVAPVLEAARPDIILSYTFPLRIPPAILAIPRLGAVNLHPSPLPAYRGPNPARMLYDGSPTLGATLHGTTAGFDAGPILSRQEAPSPQYPTIQRVLDTWQGLLIAALDEGVERLLAGEHGTPQEESRATYAAAFRPEEHWISWDWAPETIQRRVTALNLLLPTARANVGDEPVRVLEAHPVTTSSQSNPGDVITRTNDNAVVRVAGGAVTLSLAPENDTPAPDRPGGQVLEREFVRVE